MAHSDKPSSREARPSDRGCEFEAQCALQAPLFFLFLSNLFMDMYGYISFSSLFSFFFGLKLIDCIALAFV